MYFRHSEHIWEHFPNLACGVVYATGVTADVPAGDLVAKHLQRTRERMLGISESELPEIQAWRRAFAAMGMKPTQYRCASESLLRRFRKEDTLPELHPLIDLCNSVSVERGIPIAVFDCAHIEGGLTVRPANGTEHYLAFSGETETPPEGEIVFADEAGAAHARRWTHRQSSKSAIREQTSHALIVCEALHTDARDDIRQLIETLTGDLEHLLESSVTSGFVTASDPEFEVPFPT